MLNVAMHMLAWFAWFAWFACSNFSPLVPGFAIKGRGSDEAMHSRLCQQATNVAPSSTSHKKKTRHPNVAPDRGTWKVRELQSQRTQTCFSWHFLHSHRPRVRTPMVKSKNMMRTFRICEALAACPHLLPMIHTCLPASRTSKRCKKMLVNARNFSQLCALPEVKQEFMQGTNPLHQSHPHQNRAPKTHLQWDYHHLVLLPAF